MPTADGGVLRFTSSLDTIYYSVFGLDTVAIFDSIEANAPTIGTEPEGYFSAGLTEYEGQLEYQFRESLGFCWLESGSIELTFVVTLPRHEEADGLASSLLARWNQYKKEIAEHEQRHVDIFLETMREAEGGIEALSGRFPRCTSLEVAIDEVWDQALVANDAFQEEFHREVADLSRERRAPLEVQISNNQASRDQLESQIDSLIETSDQLRIEISELDDAMRSHGERIDELAAEYPDLVLPSGPYEEYEGLLSAWTSLNDERNILVSRLNDSIEAANAAVDEFNVITTATNDLNKELNWLP